MARDGTWVLVVAGGMDLNPDVDPHARTLCLANHLHASTRLENVTSPLCRGWLFHLFHTEASWNTLLCNSVLDNSHVEQVMTINICLFANPTDMWRIRLWVKVQHRRK